MIELRDVHTYRGINYVLQGVDMTIADRCCTALLGRNGMGKTTLVRSIMALTKPRSGHIVLDDKDLTGLEPFEIAKHGLALVPQGRHVFRSLSVEENLTLAARGASGDAGAWTLERIYDLFTNLKERRRNRGSDLSGGEQQMLAIGRALMTNPSLLVMDEPSEGLAPVIVDRLTEVICELRDRGLCIFLVEQNYQMAVEAADRMYILEKGRVVWDGSCDDLEGSPDVREAYLGV
ncbi:MAG: ABC transporter ATP-binding protein [Acidimicrobiales bacterium]